MKHGIVFLVLMLCTSCDALKAYQEVDPSVTWLTIPDQAQKSMGGVQAGTAIATYAQGGNQLALDSAIVLGRSLKNVTKYPKLCMVTERASQQSKDLLSKAGWQIVTVPVYTSAKFYDEANTFPRKYFIATYEKADVFRLPFEQVLYLDPDAYVRKPEKLDELIGMRLPSGSIGMVKSSLRHPMQAQWLAEHFSADNYPDGMPKALGLYNTGVMLLHPDLTKYKEVRASMDRDTGAGSLPGASINEVYRNKVVDLPDTYNVHGSHNCGSDPACASDKCGNAAVSQMTGPIKPTHAGVSLQGPPYKQWLKGGVTRKGLDGKMHEVEVAAEKMMQVIDTEERYNECPNLQEEYFCEMHNNIEFLSEDKRAEIKGLTDGGLTCKDNHRIWKGGTGASLM